MPSGSIAVNSRKNGKRCMSHQDDDEPGRRGPLIALVVTVVGVIGALYLTHALNSVGRLQDCVMSGRPNCAPVAR